VKNDNAPQEIWVVPDEVDCRCVVWAVTVGDRVWNPVVRAFVVEATRPIQRNIVFSM
jgi:hypothetical protein